jgi:hypothetical protein
MRILVIYKLYFISCFLNLLSGFCAQAAMTENLVDDLGFELGVSGFIPNQLGTSVALTRVNPIAGTQSLLIGTQGYGDSVLWQGKNLSSYPVKYASRYIVNVSLRNTQTSSSTIQICAMADYVSGSPARACKTVLGTLGDKGNIRVSLSLNSARELARVRLGIFQEGSTPLIGVMIDSFSAQLSYSSASSAFSTSRASSSLSSSINFSQANSSLNPSSIAMSSVTSSIFGDNLMEDPGFESGFSNFQPNQNGTTVNLDRVNPLAGMQSLVIGTQGYGDSILWAGKEFSNNNIRSALYKIKARIAVRTASGSAVSFCAMVDYVEGNYLSNCTSVSGSLGDKGIVEANLNLDNTRALQRVRIGIFQEGSDPLRDIFIDDVSAQLEGVFVDNTASSQQFSSASVSTPASSGQTSSRNNSFASISSTGSSVAGTPYPGFTYQLPTVRPYISLNDFTYTSPTHPAYIRLKGEVDDAVLVTEQQPATATYEQLVSALNSNHYGYSATDSVVMYRLTGNTNYILQAVRMTDLLVASEEARIQSGALPLPRVAGDSYLEVGFYIEQVALAYDYGYPFLTETQRNRWSAYVDQALYNLWHHNSAYWGNVSRPWTGWSVNDPGNNYYYSFLKATQLWALATQDNNLIQFLQTQKYTQLVPFFSRFVGGGSREGTGYGTAQGSLFEDYRYWKSSTTEDLSALSSHARDTIDYWIYATVPTFDFYAAIGDQSRSSMPRMFDYQRKLMQETVALNLGTSAAARGTWWLNRIKVTDGGAGTLQGRMRYNYNFRFDLLASEPQEQAPTALMYDANAAGIIFARSDWTTTASWMSFVAGIYDQSHAHQEQGGFSFYKNAWLSINSNVYSNSGINQGTDVHNVIRFVANNGNGETIRQYESESTKIVSDDGNLLQIRADLSPTYAPRSQEVARWTRELDYNRSLHRLTIRDTCVVGSQIKPIWQLHVPSQPLVQADGSVLAGNLKITSLSTVTNVNIVNMGNLSNQFNAGYRLELTNDAGCEFNVQLDAI